MKILSRVLLVMMAVVTLAACQQSGQGPSRPAGGSAESAK